MFMKSLLVDRHFIKEVRDYASGDRSFGMLNYAYDDELYQQASHALRKDGGDRFTFALFNGQDSYRPTSWTPHAIADYLQHHDCGYLIYP